MDAYSKKTLKTSRGYQYTYYTHEGDRSLPTLLFLHGWPDNAAMWKDVAGPLQSLGHPMIIPDMLGYDGTDKPTDPAAYKWDGMTQDLIEIADKEGAKNIVSIGHDWGSGCATRMYYYHHDRVVGVVNLNVGFYPPSRERFSLEAANKQTEQLFGYPTFAYWHLFTAPDGAAVLGNNLERVFNLMHGEGDTMKKFFTDPNAMREYLESGNADIKLRPYARDASFKDAFVCRFARDGFAGPLCWYKATVDNHQHQCDSKLSESVNKVDVPILFIGAKDDAVCRPEVMLPSIKAGLLPQLEQGEMIDAGHWMLYEKPHEIAAQIRAWLGKNLLRRVGV